MDTIQTIVFALLQLIAVSALVSAHIQDLHTYAHTVKKFRALTLESTRSGTPVLSPCLRSEDRNETLNCRLRGMPLVTLEGPP